MLSFQENGREIQNAEGRGIEERFFPSFDGKRICGGIKENEFHTLIKWMFFKNVLDLNYGLNRDYPACFSLRIFKVHVNGGIHRKK